MDAVFLKLLNMSIAAGWLIMAVIFLRLIFKKAPKWIRGILWAIVAVRLVCPFTIESSFSLIPSAETVSPAVIRYSQKPIINSGVPYINNTLNPIISASSDPAPEVSATPLQIWISIAGTIWIIGMAVMLGYALVSFLRIRGRVREAVRLRDNIWLCDAVKSPFILGVFRPQIYISSAADDEQIKYILAHEQAHLKRRDHWWQLFGYLLLAVYWFNPLMWAAYILLCRDIELACDEKVIRNMNMDSKKAYSNALVDSSVSKRMIMACPLAFGEIGVKARVKSVLNYRKPAFWIVIMAVAACVVAAVCFLTNPRTGAAANRNGIGLSSVEGLSNVGVSMLPTAVKEENSYNESVYSEDETISFLEMIVENKVDSVDPLILERAFEAVILNTISDRNSANYPEHCAFAFSNFVMLDTSAVPIDDDTAYMVTFYGWALYQRYNITEEGIEDIGGSHIPVALTFKVNEKNCKLIEYWEPGDGSYYVPDIRNKFPAHIADDGIDSQKYIVQQIQDCYSQAVRLTGLDTDAVIGRLLDKIRSSPAESSNPYDYINEHSIEYRELIYYGEYTLRYCLNRFNQGNETGLEGKVMAIVCEELLQTKDKIPENAGSAETGQMWYDTLRAHAGNKVKPYIELVV